MITGAIVTAFLACLDALTGFLPNMTIPTSAASTAGTLGYTLNRFLPVSSMALACLAVGAWRLGMAAWNLLVWIYHQFWGSD